jgi:hypothetical protein
LQGTRYFDPWSITQIPFHLNSRPPAMCYLKLTLIHTLLYCIPLPRLKGGGQPFEGGADFSKTQCLTGLASWWVLVRTKAFYLLYL